MRIQLNLASHPFVELGPLYLRLRILILLLAVVAVPFALWRPWAWELVAGLFVLGWIFQFVGHAFEGKPPEFFKDWRFLFVGLRWWFAKVSAAFARQNEDPG